MKTIVITRSTRGLGYGLAKDFLARDCALASEGWTVVLMDRASRFIWELHCGQRETDLFQQAMTTLAQVIEQTDDLALVTDGERRHGNLLFDICQATIRIGQVGRPKKP